MDLLREMVIGHRRCVHHVKVALNLALLPLILCGMLLYAQGGRVGPQLWLVAGISLGHWMMLWGAFRMHHVTLRRSAFATRLVEQSNAWFPYFQIGIHGGVAAAFVLLFWFTLSDLGLSFTWIQHVLLLALLVQWPVRRGLRFWLQGRESPSGTLAYVFLSYAHWIQFTVFLAVTLTGIMVPPEQYRTSNFPMIGLVIWLPAVLVILVMIVLFLDHIFRKSQVEESMVPRDRID